MSFVKAPTSQNDLGNQAVEGGIIFPFTAELPHGWDMGMMTEYDFMEDADGSRHHPEFINSITFGHNIIGKLGGYAEFFSLVSTDHRADWIGTVDLGLSYGLRDNVQIDAGVNLGITGAADDINPFVGLSIRF